MEQFKRDVAKVFNIKELRELCKYLGCFFDWHKNKIKIVQPELITSFTESLKIPTGPRGTPMVAGQVLLRGTIQQIMSMMSNKRRFAQALGNYCI